MAATVTRSNHLYPSADGRPVAETDWHLEATMVLIETLKRFYAEDPATYVAGNMLVFYEPGNKREHVSPDVFVVKGVSKEQRPNFLIWEEGKGPDVVIELTSASTRKEDLKQKFQVYRDIMKVREYFLFDPCEEYLKPSMQGYRLQGGEYVAIEPSGGRLTSEVLGLHLMREGTRLRLYDPVTDAVLPTAAELAQREAERADALEEEVRRLRDLLNRRNGASD
jgi:Uma2 family endonuclease